MHLFYTRLLIYSTPVWRPADLGSYHHSPLRVSGVLVTSVCTLSALLVALGPVIRIPPQFQDPPRLEPSSGLMEPAGDSAWRPPLPSHLLWLQSHPRSHSLTVTTIAIVRTGPRLLRHTLLGTLGPSSLLGTPGPSSLRHSGLSSLLGSPGLS